MALALGVIITFLPTLHGGLLDYDDPWLLGANGILGPGELRVIPQILGDMTLGTRLTLGAEYLPVRDLSVLLDFALYGRWWLGHHLTSLLLYAAGCVTVHAIFVELLGRNLRAFAVAAWFSLLPVHVENVAWLAGRKDVLGFLFFSLGLLAALRVPRSGLLIATLLCAILAIWSKGTYIVFPVVVALVVLARRREEWRPIAAVAAVLSVVVCGTAVLLSTRLGASLALFAHPRTSGPLELLALQGGIGLHYLRSMALPLGLSIEYPEAGFLPPLQMANLVGVALMVALVGGGGIALFRGRHVAALGVAVFFVGLLPVAHFAPLQNLVADRYLLVPSIGAALALGAALPAGRRFDLVLLGWAALLGVRAFDRCITFRDSDGLWADAAERYPDDPSLQIRTAVLAANKAPPNGPALLAAVVARFPTDAVVLSKAGAWHLGERQEQVAEPLLRRALAADPNERQALNNLITLLTRTGRAEEALPLASQLAAAHPLFATGLASASGVAIDAGRPDLAFEWGRAAVDLEPGSATAWCNLGGAAYQLGILEEARSGWTRCSELDPDNEFPRRALEHLRGGRP